MAIYQTEQESGGMLKQVYTGSFQNPRQDFEVTLAAGEFKTLNITYSSFWVINNTAPLYVTFDFGQSGRPTKLEEGEGFSLPFAISKLTLNNTGSGAATVKFSYGMAELYDNRTAISGTVVTAPAKMTSATAQTITIAAGGNDSVTVSGHVIVNNVSANSSTNVALFSGDGVQLTRFGSFETDYTGTVALYNKDSVNAATVSVTVLT